MATTHAVRPTAGKVATLLQEELFRGGDPWRLLVGCVLLNQTSRKQVDQVVEHLLSRWPDACAMAGADEDELARVLRPLGLHNRRARSLRLLSSQCADLFIAETGACPASAESVAQLHGVGKYALDSYRIFVLGEELRPDDVEDRVLKAYLSA